LGADFEEQLTGGLNGGIYPAYVGWCKESGYKPLAKNKFSSELERTLPHFRRSERKVTALDGKRRDVVFIGGARLLME